MHLHKNSYIYFLLHMYADFQKKFGNLRGERQGVNSVLAKQHGLFNFKRNVEQKWVKCVF